MKKTLLTILTCTISCISFAQICIGVTGGLNLSKVKIDEQTEMGFTGASSFKIQRTSNLYYGFILSSALGTQGRVNLQLGFNVLNKGYKSVAEFSNPFTSTTFKREYSIKNFEVPLSLRIVLGRPNIGVDPYLIGGAYLGFIRKAHVDYTDEMVDLSTGETLDKDEYESDHKPYNEEDLAGSNIFFNGMFLSTERDLGVLYGAGLAFNLVPNGVKLFIEAKSSRSFNNRSVYFDMNGNPSDPKIGNRVFYLSTGLLIPLFSGGVDKRKDD